MSTNEYGQVLMFLWYCPHQELMCTILASVSAQGRNSAVLKVCTPDVPKVTADCRSRMPCLLDKELGSLETSTFQFSL
jgi:hypothetical protein